MKQQIDTDTALRAPSEYRMGLLIEEVADEADAWKATYVLDDATGKNIGLLSFIIGGDDDPHKIDFYAADCCVQLHDGTSFLRIWGIIFQAEGRQFEGTEEGGALRVADEIIGMFAAHRGEL